jgi:hypothetical protein
VYLLIGLAFAFLFAPTAIVSGAQFFVSTSDAGAADYVYFNYVTLATEGYGDLVARTTLGRMLSATEALTGQIYLMTIVALLVSNFRSQPSTNRDE